MIKEEKIVSENELKRDGKITLLNGEPFTGVCIDYYESGKKESEKNYKDGKKAGLVIEWSKTERKNIRDISKMATNNSFSV